jgi:hypothetical protein
MRTRVEIEIKAAHTDWPRRAAQRNIAWMGADARRNLDSLSDSILAAEDERILAALDSAQGATHTTAAPNENPISLESILETMEELQSLPPIETPQQVLARLGNAPIRPDRILMSHQDFDDILSWGEGFPSDPFRDMDLPPLRNYSHLIVTTE